MPLILAIEPNRRQASRIRALAPALVDADFLIADSTERGIAALDGRVPDLILTSLLLSPKDDAKLQELNSGDAVGTGGFHVQTLMIPVLAPVDRPSGNRTGILGRLPWAKRHDGAADGCDPAVFAAQIVEYLDHVAAERASLDIDRELDSVSAHVDSEVDALPGVESAPELEPAPEFALEPAPALEPGPVPELELEPTTASELVPELALELVTEAESAPELELVTETEPELEFLTETESELEASAAESFVPAVAIETADDPWQEITIDDDEGSASIVLTSELIDLQAFVEELGAVDQFDVLATAPIDLEVPQPAIPDPLEPTPPEAPRFAAVHSLPAPPAWPPLEGVLAEEAIINDFIAALDSLATEPCELYEPTEHSGHSELGEPGESGEPDEPGDPCEPCESREPGDSREVTLWDSGELANLHASWPQLQGVVVDTKKGGRPAEDEWGFFDPEQCGFRALLTKLDEITK